MMTNQVMKKALLILLVFVCLVFFTTHHALSSPIPTIHLFWAEGCPHCAHEKEFLNDYLKENKNIVVEYYEITRDKDNLELLQKVGQVLKADVAGVPFTVVGNKYIVGFQDAGTTGTEIVKLVQDYENNDIVSTIINDASLDRNVEALPNVINKDGGDIPEKINLPLLGTIETKHMSLPLLTFVIAILDGFNPCAMWTLLFLISLLLGMQDKRRMWIIGTTFIVTSAFIYFLFLSAWLHLFLFLGYIVWVRLAVALVALGAGVYYLWDFWKNREGTCSLANNKERKLVFDRLKTLTQSKKFVMAIIGIALLAIAVNMVELICSAGLPAVYTNILSLSKLTSWQYYAYLVFYILVFMMDDLFVFFAAMITLKSVHADSKLARYSHLIGGMLMAIIGLLLIFKPGWLMFG